MNKLMDAVERLLFGATAEERVAMLAELAARRAQHRMAVALADDGDNDTTPPETEPASGEE